MQSDLNIFKHKKEFLFKETLFFKLTNQFERFSNSKVKLFQSTHNLIEINFQSGFHHQFMFEFQIVPYK